MGRLETVKLPEGLVTIGDNAFNGSAVKDVITIGKDGQPVENGEGKLPSSVTTIGENAFKDTDLRNPAGIYDAETGEVSGGLFDLIDNNTSDNGLSIGDNAFAGTSVGPAVKLPGNTTSVGAGAFDDVALGNTITIPSRVESLGKGAFTGNDRNDSITSVVVEPNENITGQTIANAFADITGDAASGFETNNPASTVKELTIPVDMVDTQAEVDAIHAAFPNLEKITITGGGDSSVTTIPSDVSFDAFDKVTDLVIEEGVTGISTTEEGETAGNGTFAGMDSLTSVTLPESLINIGDNAFSGNESLKNVATSSADGSTVTNGRLPSTVETVGDNAFANTGISGDIFAGNDSLKEIGDGAFSGITGSLGDEDGKLTIPDTVTTIGKDAFKGTDSIKDVTIPSSVESLGSGAFADTGLTSVTIEDNSNFENTSPVNKLDELYAAFVSRDENGDITSAADKVTSLTIPEKLYDQDKIKDTFPNLEEIRITASESGHVEGGLDLGSLDKVTSVTADDGVIISKLPEGITEIGITADQLKSDGLPESITGNITSVVVLPGTDSNNNEVTTIPGGAFDGAANLENVKIEEGITAVGSTEEDSKPLFGNTGASKPVTVELPSSVTTIGDKVFADDKITVTLPEEGADKITSVGNGAFEGNKNVTNDILDKLTGLESIGDNAFADTSISGEVTIPSSVDNLGSGAFAGNDGITSVVVEPNDKLTGDDIAKGFATITGEGTDNPASSVKELTIPADMIKEQADVDALHKAFPNLEKLVITGNEDHRK